MSDDTLSLLPSSYILADDVDVVSNFLMSIFDINDNTNTNSNSSSNSGQTSPTNSNLSMKYDYKDKQDKVMKYNSIRISDKNTIIIIQKSSVSDTLLSVVRSVSVRQIFVTCKDPGIFIIIITIIIITIIIIMIITIIIIMIITIIIIIITY